MAGNSGRFLVSADEVVVLADSRYTIQAAREAPGARVEPVTYDMAAGWADARPVASAHVGSAVEAGFVSHAIWRALESAAPEVELVPVDGWVEADRATKEPAEVERIRAAAAVADRALAALLPEIRVGATEAELAWRLEVLMRTSGGGRARVRRRVPRRPRGGAAARIAGRPARPRRRGAAVRLRGARGRLPERHDADALRGEAGRSRPRRCTTSSRGHRRATIDLLAGVRVADGTSPSGREVDAAARSVIEAAGLGERFGHGTGHGIGLATHESPSLSRVATETPLPSPTVFSVEPGVYLEGETGVRIEDLVLLDTADRRLEHLTTFPRGIVVVG